MKVIKRDGKAVDYDRSKIFDTIELANQEVKTNEKANQDEIKQIVKYIEGLEKKRILVEDIQNIIEEQLMDMKKFELAKSYIINRYNDDLLKDYEASLTESQSNVNESVYIENFKAVKNLVNVR